MGNLRSNTGKNLRSHTRNVERRERRQKEANERNEAWASLSPKMRLVSLAGRRGSSSRQIARIKAQLAEESAS